MDNNQLKKPTNSDSTIPCLNFIWLWYNADGQTFTFIGHFTHSQYILIQAPEPVYMASRLNGETESRE